MKKKILLVLILAITCLTIVIVINVMTYQKERIIQTSVFGNHETHGFLNKEELNEFVDNHIKNYHTNLKNVSHTEFETIINDQQNNYEIDFNDINSVILNVNETVIVSEERVLEDVVNTVEITNNYQNSTLLNSNETIVNSVKKNLEIDSQNFISEPDSLTAVINKNRLLKKEYVPNNLVNITVSSTKSGENNLIRSDVLPNLEKMFADAKSQNIHLIITSAYRSYYTQQTLFNNYVENYGREEAMKFSAPPGASEHQSGLVVDIGEINGPYDNFSIEFANSDSGKWLANNAYKYGFILRYPEGKESITTYQFEPWHYRYVGTEQAKDIFESGLTLEEFYNLY